MRQKYTALLLLLFVITIVFSACGEYKPADKVPGANGNNTGDVIVSTPSKDPEEMKNPFTATIVVNGKPYIPDAEHPIQVQWTDGYSLYQSQVDENGVAWMDGLDGDYSVTLLTVPDGYAYNPNAYVATNNNRNIEIDLYKIVTTTGKGNSLYNCITIRSTGIYCVELDDAEDEVFYEFAPSKSGTYSVEGWVDVAANEVNPQAKYYGANAFFKQLQYVADDGGAEGTYTKNFKLDVEIADEMISTGGQVTFSFGITASSKTNEYPVKVYFAVKLDGEFSLNHSNATIMVPTEKLEPQPDYDKSKYTLVGAEFKKTVGGNTANVFDSDNYKLWKKKDGGDGYYHLYDAEKYASTSGYGPILYAYVSQPCRFMDASFNTIEMRGNKALTVSGGTENYKLFIEGFEALLIDPPGDNGPYFCVTNCPCREKNTCTGVDKGLPKGACTEACENCHVDCRRCPEEAIGKKGYSDYCNSDGVYGVTEELKDFLQKYSISQLLFFDGNGFVETNPQVSVYAAEEDQWLFACGYYKEK